MLAACKRRLGGPTALPACWQSPPMLPLVGRLGGALVVLSPACPSWLVLYPPCGKALAQDHLAVPLLCREAGQLLEHAHGLGLGPTNVEHAIMLAAGDWEEVRARAPLLCPVGGRLSTRACPPIGLVRCSPVKPKASVCQPLPHVLHIKSCRHANIWARWRQLPAPRTAAAPAAQGWRLLLCHRPCLCQRLWTTARTRFLLEQQQRQAAGGLVTGDRRLPLQLPPGRQPSRFQPSPSHWQSTAGWSRQQMRQQAHLKHQLRAACNSVLWQWSRRRQVQCSRQRLSPLSWQALNPLWMPSAQPGKREGMKRQLVSRSCQLQRQRRQEWHRRRQQRHQRRQLRGRKQQPQSRCLCSNCNRWLLLGSLGQRMRKCWRHPVPGFQQ